MFNKIVEPEEALRIVKDNSIVAVSGFNMIATPAYLISKLYEVYSTYGHPRNLFIIAETCPGTPGKGLDLVGKKIIENKDYDFLKGVLIPFYGWIPNIARLVEENIIEGYNWPIGIVSHWFREVAAGRPGVLTKVGLGTMFDPRYGGGLVNNLAEERKTCRVDLVILGDEEYLLYMCPKPNVALIRGTTADEIGNISMEHEGALLNVLAIAQSAKACPEKGITIAQVKRVTRAGFIGPRNVYVPAPLVDYVVVAPELLEFHGQTDTILYDPTISGEIIPSQKFLKSSTLRLGVRKIIARRVTLELASLVVSLGRPILVNLGIGIPADVASVINEENIDEFIYMTVESGPFGGVALTGADFGASRGYFAVVSMADMFTNYEGGIIDAASLGFMQVDELGNVNPAFLPGRMPGAGGFPVIAFGTPHLYFAGEFTAGERKIEVSGNSLKITKDGSVSKFVKRVYKVVYSGSYGIKKKQKVFFITERAVFELGERGLELIEVAPEIDIEKDILAKMEFKPRIPSNIKYMSKDLFSEKPLNLRSLVLEALRR
ncbi:MAG: CoA-transferase [Desulfurococcaceae archaeon TW002]